MKPIDLLKHAINPENFNTHLCNSLGVTNTRIPSLSYAPIDVTKFGDYFNKITGGALNSIIKRNSPSATDHFEFVVKDRIGYRKRNGSGNFNGNGRYSKINNIFKTLHAEHIPLVCKKDKRAIVADFVALKEETQAEFHDIEALAMDFVPPEITISDVFILGHKQPTMGSYAYKQDGFMALNPRIIMKKDITITMDDYGDWYGIAPITEHSYNKYVQVVNSGGLQLSASFNDEIPSDNIFLPPTGNNIQLFEVSARGKYIGIGDDEKTRVFTTTVYNTYFDGIDIIGMTIALGERLNNIHITFNNRLDALAEKYASEMIMYEICNGKSAI